MPELYKMTYKMTTTAILNGFSSYPTLPCRVILGLCTRFKFYREEYSTHITLWSPTIFLYVSNFIWIIWRYSSLESICLQYSARWTHLWLHSSGSVIWTALFWKHIPLLTHFLNNICWIIFHNFHTFSIASLWPTSSSDAITPSPSIPFCIL